MTSSTPSMKHRLVRGLAIGAVAALTYVVLTNVIALRFDFWDLPSSTLVPAALCIVLGGLGLGIQSWTRGNAVAVVFLGAAITGLLFAAVGAPGIRASIMPMGLGRLLLAIAPGMVAALLSLAFTSHDPMLDDE